MSSEFGIPTSGFTEEQEDSIAYGFTDANICGESAACTVYRMRIDGFRVAVKRLRPEHLTNPVYVAAYRKEYVIGRQLKHDGLPVYREFHDKMGEVYIVMDYVDGTALNEFLGSEAGGEYFRSAENVRHFLDELLSVTTYLHRSGVIHCDLKPANIMLRHSDMGVMLIDLDKAYSDTLDMTHGGTKNNSTPTEPGQKPTAQKDFAAIGLIVDAMAASIAGFPKSACARFRKECGAETTSPERLRKALRPRQYVKAAIVTTAAIVILAIGSVIGYLSSIRETPRPDIAPVSATAADTADTGSDTAVNKGVAAPGQPSAVIAPEVKTPERQPAEELVIDPAEIDRRFSHLMGKMDRGLHRLKSGKMTLQEITDMMQPIGTEYQTIYGKVRTDYRAKYPQKSAVDVEYALIRAYEKSRITYKYMDFMRACSDSISSRGKALL